MLVYSLTFNSKYVKIMGLKGLKSVVLISGEQIKHMTIHVRHIKSLNDCPCIIKYDLWISQKIRLNWVASTQFVMDHFYQDPLLR